MESVFRNATGEFRHHIMLEYENTVKRKVMLKNITI